MTTATTSVRVQMVMVFNYQLFKSGTIAFTGIDQDVVCVPARTLIVNLNYGIPYLDGGLQWAQTDCALAACSCVENICAQSCNLADTQLRVRIAWTGTDANGAALSSLEKTRRPQQLSMSASDDDIPSRGGGGVGSSGMDEEELGLPKTTISKIIQEVLPGDIWCSKEARDLIADCCLVRSTDIDTRFESCVFLMKMTDLVLSAANEICDKEAKKAITGDHVLSALKELGFEDYLAEVNEALGDHNRLNKERKQRSNRFENSGISPEEKLRRQEELIEQARLSMLTGMNESQEGNFQSQVDPPDSTQ
ncbi:negative cofactor 2 transcription regulator complex subunit ncb2 [Entophlyctis luteolus]|nr:negative cofactor 2 transcription regulator complex subunit ncb2 [Entophlyctis luteolus]